MAGFRTLDEEIRDTPSIQREDVEAIKEWAKKQPHLPDFSKLPEGFIDTTIAMILKRRYNSVERAKETFDNYFTFRELAPELCFSRSVRSKEIQLYLTMNHTMVMDKRDSEGNIVLFQYLHDPDFGKYDYISSVRAILMVLESWLFENGSAGCPGLTLVFDQRNFSLTHLASVPLTSIKKLNHFNKDCAPISVRNIYVVHATNFIQTILTVIKPFMQGELFQRIKTFTPQQIEEFYKVVPKEAVPNEFGGTAGALEDLDMKSVKRLERNEYIFQTYEKLHVEESKRQGPQKNAHNMFGLEGSFKKLNVD